MGFFKKKKKEELGLSMPYCISIINSTEAKQDWVLFGSNKFAGQPNSGNIQGITIEDLNGNSYESILNEFNSNYMKVRKTRFQTNNIENMNQNIHHHKHLNGGGFGTISYERRDFNIACCKDAYQQQSDIVDIDYPMYIDASTHLTGTIEPNSRITITFMPIETGDGKFKIERLTGKNVAPVLILSHISSKFSFLKRIKNYFKLRKFNKQQSK